MYFVDWQLFALIACGFTPPPLNFVNTLITIQCIQVLVHLKICYSTFKCSTMFPFPKMKNENDCTNVRVIFFSFGFPSDLLTAHAVKHSALQLGFYIPVTQNDSPVHKVSQMRHSQFLVWEQTVEGSGFKRKGVCCLDKCKQRSTCRHSRL